MTPSSVGCCDREKMKTPQDLKSWDPKIPNDLNSIPKGYLTLGPPGASRNPMRVSKSAWLAHLPGGKSHLPLLSVTQVCLKILLVPHRRNWAAFWIQPPAREANVYIHSAPGSPIPSMQLLGRRSPHPSHCPATSPLLLSSCSLFQANVLLSGCGFLPGFCFCSYEFLSLGCCLSPYLYLPAHEIWCIWASAFPQALHSSPPSQPGGTLGESFVFIPPLTIWVTATEMQFFSFLNQFYCNRTYILKNASILRVQINEFWQIMYNHANTLHWETENVYHLK
jgi:hypothetical protein